ncbi:MAG: 1-acyl-sn-glycerol-3-phosphate acyltransferase [Methylophilaceae bacterium]|nr:1-acyl-sn-glycerol-3-phosphate acyltransferase [Methylophilaceae bacterium]
MIYLRSIVFNLGMWIMVIPYALLALILIPMAAPRRSYIIAGWARFVMRWLALTCNLRYRVIGREHIPDRPCIILAKHQSAWETIAFQEIFPPQIWVLKRSLLLLPFFGWALWALRSIAIDRSAGREALKQLVEQGKDRLNSGLCVVVFPEGTRVAPGQKGKYHIGGAWLATHAGATVIPVAHNAGEFWGRNSLLKRPGLITVSIGAPIDATGMKADVLNKRIEDWIESEMPRLNEYV